MRAVGEVGHGEEISNFLQGRMALLCVAIVVFAMLLCCYCAAMLATYFFHLVS